MDVERLKGYLNEAKALVEKLGDSIAEELKPYIFSAVLTKILLEDMPQREISTPMNKLVEFIGKEAFSTYTDVIMAIAYYSLHIDGKNEGFNIPDLRRYYAETRRQFPANIKDIVNKIVKRGLLAPRDVDKTGYKRWVITPEGENYVEANMSKEGQG